MSTRATKESPLQGRSSDLHQSSVGGACPRSTPTAASTPARVAQKADYAPKSGLFGQPGGEDNRYDV